MRIMVLADGECFSPLAGCAIYEVPEQMDTAAIEAALAGGDLAALQRFDGNPPPEEFIRLTYTEEDVRQWAEDSDGEVDEQEALKRAREWGIHIQDTAARLCSEQLMEVVLGGQP